MSIREYDCIIQDCTSEIAEYFNQTVIIKCLF